MGAMEIFAFWIVCGENQGAGVRAACFCVEGNSEFCTFSWENREFCCVECDFWQVCLDLGDFQVFCTGVGEGEH